MPKVIRLTWPDLNQIDDVEALHEAMNAKRKRVEKLLEERSTERILISSPESLPRRNPSMGLSLNSFRSSRPQQRTVTRVRSVHAPQDSISLYVDADKKVLDDLSHVSDDIRGTDKDETWLRLPSPVMTAAQGANTNPPNDNYLKQIGVDDNILGTWDGKGVVVSIIDSGIDIGHKEFKNTRFDKRNSLDYYSKNPKPGIIVPIKLPEGQAYADRHFHGTSVAGLVAGQSHGIARGSTLISHNVFYKTRRARVAQQSDIDIARSRTDYAILASVMSMANIICMSLGVRGYDNQFKYEISGAYYGHKQLIVAASGNDGFGTHLSPGDYSEVLSVGAVDANDQVWEYTSAVRFKKKDGTLHPHPDIYAPGVNIPVSVPTTISTSGYLVASGTSFAAPLVAGSAALVLGYYKDQGKTIHPSEIKAHLLKTADDINLPQDIGGGIGKRLNVRRAMETLRTSFSIPTSSHI